MIKRLLLSTLLVAMPTFAAEPKVSFFEPAISPSRAEIAFVSGGDIWTVPSAGGEARLVVSHAAYDSRPLYSPDGKKLASGMVELVERKTRTSTDVPVVEAAAAVHSRLQ